MAIEDIFKALEEQGEQESREALEAAREQARGIVEDAVAAAEHARAVKAEAAKAHSELRLVRVLNSARLDARRTVAGVKEKEIVKSFDEALVHMDTLRSRPGYADLFAALAAEALEGLTGDVTLVVAPEDEALARQALAASGMQGSVDATAKTRGGLTVLAHGGSMLRRNTVEDRLEKYRKYGQSDVAEVLSA
jgi:vacuolar-type H+-ATPase subunit E/Vma4